MSAPYTGAMSTSKAELEPRQTESQPPSSQSRDRRRVWRIAVVVAAAVIAYSAYDLYWPRQASLRDFDPDEVARLDTAMWRSYYARQRVRMFAQLAELMRSQYRLPFLRSNSVAYQAARAAFVFKDGHSREDYERALPNLEKFFAEI